MTTLKILALALALAAPQVALAQAPADDTALTLSFPDLKTRTGVIYIAVFDDPAAWASGKAKRVAIASAADAAPTANLSGLAPGVYAARVFQDLDGDGKLDNNPFGLPVEPYGFSNGAQPNMGPPSFEDAAFTVAPGANLQSIALK